MENFEKKLKDPLELISNKYHNTFPHIAQVIVFPYCMMNQLQNTRQMNSAKKNIIKSVFQSKQFYTRIQKSVAKVVKEFIVSN